jgi:PAS domain S-box-containing protein
MTDTAHTLADRDWARLGATYAAPIGSLRDVALLLFDRDLRYRFVTGPVERHGSRPADLLGRTVHDVLPQAQASVLAAQYRAVLTGERRTLDTPGVRNPAATWTVAITPIRDDHGEIIGGMAVAQEVTERRATGFRNDRQVAELRRQAELLDLAHDAVLLRTPDGQITYCNSGAETVYGWSRTELVGSVTHRLFRTAFPVSRDAQDRALAADGWWEGELTHTRRDGTTITVHSRQALRRDDDGRADLVIEINRDMTPHRRAEAKLGERVRWLEALRQVTVTILDGSSLDATLELVARFGRELAGADASGVTVPAGEPGRLRVRAVDGAHAGLLRDAELPVKGSVAGEVFSAGRPVVLPDASADPRKSQPVVRSGLFGPAMFVPLFARDGVFGTLMVARLSGGRPFETDELELVQTFADQASIAYEYARAQRNLQRLAVFEDRERIGGELHDAVIQSLFAIGLHLQATASMTADAGIADRIEESVRDLDDTMENLRRRIFELRLGVSADRRLERALHALAVELRTTGGIMTVLEVDPPTAALLGDHAAELTGLIRTALTTPDGRTAVTCRIRLHREADQAVLGVEDDAPGPLPSHSALRLRAERIGGRLELAADPAGGMSLRLCLPLPV